MSEQPNITTDQERRIREFQIRNFGARYESASLSSIRLSQSAQNKMAAFLEKPKNFLIFCGNPGIGKTYFCSSLIPWAFQTFDNFRYWNESELLKRIRSSMNEMKGDYLETLKHLIDDQLIIFDDIGSTGLNDWREEVLFDLVDERYNTMLPTVFTSNFSVADFKKIYHPRICSRLFAKENTIIEILDGDDLRATGV